MIDAKVDATMLERIMAADVEKLTPNELKIRLQALESKIQILETKEIQEKHASDLTGIGPDDEVWINMVTGPMGDVFRMGDTKYPPGRIKVKKRIAEHLQYLVSNAYQIEREKLISRSNMAQSAMLRGEDIAKIERYNQILAED